MPDPCYDATHDRCDHRSQWSTTRTGTRIDAGCLRDAEGVQASSSENLAGSEVEDGEEVASEDEGMPSAEGA